MSSNVHRSSTSVRSVSDEAQNVSTFHVNYFNFKAVVFVSVLYYVDLRVALLLVLYLYLYLYFSLFFSDFCAVWP